MKKITLEMTLKPFRQTDDAYIRQVCNTVFEQWKPLLNKADCASVMLWSADGSELLDYRGRMEDSFEWAYMIGGANQKEHINTVLDPEGLGLHTRHYDYMENPPIMTYGILRKIVSELKAVGQQYFPEKTIRIGTTFDPGPEFAKSSFKYERHPEICMGNDMGVGSMVCSYAVLHQDHTNYAAFPDGIPEGTPFGTFFGKQANIFMKDLGFDYIWFSNGLGFGKETWRGVGAVFDGESFRIEELESVKQAAIDFWRFFRKECPDFPIETRGTNLSMGIDLASDGVPLKKIYDGNYNLLPPPNSPWAAIDGDFGLELMGYMSRIAELPGEDYLFRFYLHDPWWVNTPWYDRYNSQPHDIYLPLGIGRIDEKGRIQPPTNLNLLSIDNSFGELPESCVLEPLPHILKAIKEAPDALPPLVWVYPFREYSECKDEYTMRQMYAGDWFVRGAINDGVPIAAVVSTDNFVKHDKATYSSSILLSPIPEAGQAYEEQIISYVEQGGKVIFYGNPEKAGEKFLAAMGLTIADHGVEGILDIMVEGKKQLPLCHHSLLSGGDICTKAEDGEVFASIGNYAVAIARRNAIWIRGTVSCDFTTGQKLLVPHDEQIYFRSETLLRLALKRLGLREEFEKHLGTPSPVLMLHRSNNAYLFSCYCASTMVKIRLKLPLGAPLLDGYDTELEDGCATYRFPMAEHRECRVLVEQQTGVVRCREISPVSAQFRRRIKVSGLSNATVRFFPEKYCLNDVTAVLNASPRGDFYAVGEEFEGEYRQVGQDFFYEIKNVTGNLVFSMPRIEK